MERSLGSIIQDEETMVDELILPFSRAWNVRLIRHLFCSEDVEVILYLHIPSIIQEDKLTWTADNHGKLSLKSVHAFISGTNQHHHQLLADEWKKIWLLPMPDRLKLRL